MHTPCRASLLQRPSAAPPCAQGLGWAAVGRAPWQAALRHQRAAQRRQHPQRLLLCAAEGGSSQQSAPNGQPDNILEYPVVVLAGFYIQELATVRELLDQIGGQDVRVVPSSPALLHQPVAVALSQPEPAWDSPVPPDWMQGGGWGQQRMVLVAGIEEEGRRIILELLREVELGSICPAVATPQNLGAPLGEVLAAALRQWRQACSHGAGVAEAAAPPAAATAALAASPAAKDTEIPVVDALPPLETVVPEEVWQPASGSNDQAGGTGVHLAGNLGSSAHEVVQAQFAERPPQPAAGQASPAAAEVPLDVIDVIATGGSGSSSGSSSKAFGSPAHGSPAAAAPMPAAGAASAAAASAGGQRQPAQPAAAGGSKLSAAVGDSPELDSMDSEELLAAARAALGLDSANLQRLIDDAAAQAAAALNVPFVAGEGADAASGAVAGDFGGSASNAAARHTSSGSRKPWELPAAVAQGSSDPRSGSAAGAPAFKGFGSSAPVRNKQQRRGSSFKKQANGSRQAAAQQQAAGAAAAAMAGGAAAVPITSAGADSGVAAAEELQRQRQEQPAGDEGHILPPVDQFVLSKAQLKEVTERHGLDFEQLLAGLAERGIDLSE